MTTRITKKFADETTAATSACALVAYSENTLSEDVDYGAIGRAVLQAIAVPRLQAELEVLEAGIAVARQFLASARAGAFDPDYSDFWTEIVFSVFPEISDTGAIEHEEEIMEIVKDARRFASACAVVPMCGPVKPIFNTPEERAEFHADFADYL
jgi:hypothetical protein